jgi:hypothetical protein
MHRIDAQVSGQAVRLRLAPFANGDRRGARRLVAGVALPVSRRVAQTVEVRHRNRRQPLIDSLLVLAEFALQDAPRRRSAQVPVGFVDVGQ